jgi:hypothetical protein
MEDESSASCTIRAQRVSVRSIRRAHGDVATAKPRGLRIGSDIDPVSPAYKRTAWALIASVLYAL